MAIVKKSKENTDLLLQQLMDDIDRLREISMGMGMGMWTMPQEELATRVAGEKTPGPYIYAQSWTSSARPGTNVRCAVYVANPDAMSIYPIFMTMFFGLGNFLPIGEAWIGRDKRFSEISTARQMMPGMSTRVFNFQFRVPNVPEGNYLGNSVLWKAEWHDTGIHYDRGFFDVYIDSQSPFTGVPPMQGDPMSGAV